MKKPELLAPAGSFSSLIAAIEAGCDAVYLSGKLYGARVFASNFDNEELISAIEYAHQYSVRVYVTINTLVYEDEVNNFIKYVDFLYINNVDAVIIQDIGMFDLIRQLYPNLEIHISTQMHIHNVEGCQMVERLGASRVVLARETPYELIKKIKDNVNLELEVFVHGALCISYSGQCLMSSLIGGRSGNRGTCAQCCRQPYDLYADEIKINRDKFLLSTKDLNTLENIGHLIEIGVDSFKIEGRMKRPEYVYLVVSLYRQAIDNYLKYGKTNINKKNIYELKKLFNRDFTNGFLFNNNDNLINSFRPNHMGIKVGTVISVMKNRVTIKLCDKLSVKDGIRFIGLNDTGMNVQVMFKGTKKITNADKNDTVTIVSKIIPMVNSTVLKTTDYNQISIINEKIKQHNRKVPLHLKLIAKIDSHIIIEVSDDINNKVKLESEYIVEKSNKCSMNKENVIKQMSKTNNTVYSVESIVVLLDQNIFIPVKVLNDLRRAALNKITEKRKKYRSIVKGQYNRLLPNFKPSNNKILQLSSYSHYTKIKPIKYDEIILPYQQKDAEIEGCRYKLPRVMEFLPNVNGTLLIGELGSVLKYCSEKNDIATDFSLNVTNSYSVALLHSLGVKKVTLSLELNDYQIKKLIDNYHKRYNKHPNLELIVSGTPEAMVLKYDLLNDNYDSNKKFYLKDKYGNRFPVIKKDNLTYIYNFYSIKKKDETKYFKLGINNLRENSSF